MLLLSSITTFIDETTILLATDSSRQSKDIILIEITKDHYTNNNLRVFV